MSYSFTQTATESFTLTHARKLSSKVVTDMVRCSQLYGRPSQSAIQNYGEELAVLLNGGFVATYEFGFEKNDKRMLSWFYTVDASGAIKEDSRPGGILSGADVAGAVFFNFMNRSSKWWQLTEAEREKINRALPFIRISASPPEDGFGYWENDRNYYAGGVGLGRRSFKPLR